MGSAKRNNPAFITTSYILNTMSCIVIITVVIEPQIIFNITAEVLHSTLVVNVSQLLALHVFHIRPAARILARIPLGHDGSLWLLCLLRY